MFILVTAVSIALSHTTQSNVRSAPGPLRPENLITPGTHAFVYVGSD
jgi:hypothetical protein